MSEPTDRPRDPRAELDDVESQLRTLGADYAASTDAMDPDTAGGRDSEDIAAALTQRAENQALIDALTARRDALRAELGES